MTLLPEFVGDLVPSRGLGEVAGVYSSALLVRWHDGAWTAVVPSDGDTYPWAVRVGLLPTTVHRGDPAVATSKALQLGPVTLDTTRTVPRAVPDRPEVGGSKDPDVLLARMEDELEALDREVLGRYRAHTARLTSTTTPTELLATAAPVIGAGSGLTPFGDDLLVGTLASLSVVATAPVDPDEQEVAELTAGTSDLSAWFLQMAVRGHVGSHLHGLATAWASGDRSGITRHLRALATFGATSGRGMALGVAHTFDTLPTGATS